METATKIDIERKWIATQPCIQVHAKKKMDEMPAFFRETFPKLYGYASARTKPGAAFGRYYDWSKELIDFDAGIVVNTAIPGEGDIQAGKFGGHEALFARHEGPYGKVEAVYAAMQECMKKHELQAAGAPYEVYLNSPDEVTESELKTEVYWPVK